MSHSEEAVIDEIRKASRKRPKRRFIFNEWPRDPKGAVMKASPRGKETSNGIGIWGETLNDIVFIQRIPDCPYVKTISSRSKIAAFMKEIGEDTYSPDDMDEAEEEGYPMRHVPYPTLWQINKVSPIGLFHNTCISPRATSERSKKARPFHYAGAQAG